MSSIKTIIFNEEEFIKELIPIPKKTYLLDEDKLEEKQKMINALCDDKEDKKLLSRKILTSIFELTKHIDFETFIYHLYQSVRKFEKFKH